LRSYATRSHPHPSPSQTGSRAARLPPKPGRNFFDSAEEAEILRNQRPLAASLKTVRDVPTRNGPETQRPDTGNRRGICSLNVLEITGVGNDGRTRVEVRRRSTVIDDYRKAAVDDQTKHDFYVMALARGDDIHPRRDSGRRPQLGRS
jgi:hypothetical protein